ncbi:ArsR/SmtB family transcription factor [Cellulomonas sp. NPDC057328]|uniref:ArsR/SmtB family transcription factor n=1 Tax=Cellulomonas sp. NPDC057328 TaxID=3346101 RepID=UPI00363DD432
MEAVHGEPGLAAAAQLFKVLGHESRLLLLRLLAEQPRTVGALVDATGTPQPLVSQHLRTLRQGGLVTATRTGREVTYAVADVHVAHVVADALAHVREPVRAEDPLPAPEEEPA